MNAKKIITLVTTLSLLTTVAFCAESETIDNHPIIGIQLDASPLSELLTKHLGLSPGQGLRISNIMEGSAGEKAGLDKDDIIISFQGESVDDYDYFVDAIQNAGVGAEVSLEIIHLGQRKTISLKLETLKGQPQWKYPMEPQIEQLWRPGRIFRLKPGDEDWAEILAESLPSDIKSNITTIFKEIYSFQHKLNGKEYTITIEGNPDDGDSMVTIKTDNEEYKTTVSEIDKLPKEYQEVAEQALDNAKKTTREQRIINSLRERDGFSSKLMDTTPRQYLRRWIIAPGDQDNSIYEKIEKQMSQLQERIQELEKSQSELLDRLSEKIENLKNQEQDEPML